MKLVHSLAWVTPKIRNQKQEKGNRNIGVTVTGTSTMPFSLYNSLLLKILQYLPGTYVGRNELSYSNPASFNVFKGMGKNL